MTVEETVEQACRVACHDAREFQCDKCKYVDKSRTNACLWHDHTVDVLSSPKPGNLLPGGNVVVSEKLLDAVDCVIESGTRLRSDPGTHELFLAVLCGQMAILAAGENDEPD